VLSRFRTSRRWASQRSFRSSQTPKKRPSSLGAIRVASSWRPCCQGFLVRVKWISSLFSGANVRPLVKAHCLHVSQASSSWRQVLASDIPRASIFVSSANPSRLKCGCLAAIVSYKGARKRMARIGDSGEPCGTPALILTGSLLSLLKKRVACLS